MRATTESAARVGVEGLEADLEHQRALLAGRVPAYDHLLRVLGLLIQEPAIAARCAEAFQRTFFARYDRPLLLLAALRHDALRAGPAHPLYDAIAAERPEPDAITREAVEAALAPGAGVFTALASRRVQTNETLRAVAWRWPAALAGCGAGGRELVLVDVGASAGLNLVADALPAPWLDEAGAPLPVASAVVTPLRLGLDARPLDPTGPDATWLRACVWPGDRQRLQRLEAALAAWRAAPARMEQVDVQEAPARITTLLAEAPPRALVLVYQTVVRDYLPPAVAAGWRQSMRALIAAAPPSELVWVELEAASAPDPAWPAALTAHVRGPEGAEALELARTHWHPTTLQLDRVAAARFAGLAGIR